MRRRYLVLIVGLCLALLAACGPSGTPTSPAPTDTPSPTATPTESPDRHYEPAGGFSYVPPEGWELVEAPSLAYEVAVGPVVDGFAANMTIVDEPFNGSLEEYLSSSLDGLSQYFASFQVLSQDEFEPGAGSPGVRIVAENEQSGRVMRQTFYMFDAGAKKVVVTCTRLAEAGEDLDAACEASMETFRLESK